jgi:neutral ceramidase
LRGPLRAAIKDVTLEFAPPPSVAELEQRAQSSKDKAEQRHAKTLLKQLKEKGAFTTTYPCKVQVIRFGDDLTLVAIAGEVVVDYSLRLKRELTDTPLWVMGYSNDVFGYLPSLRVLQEGGYEGGGAMTGTSFPGPFAPSVETLVVDAVRELNSRVTKGNER